MDSRSVDALVLEVSNVIRKHAIEMMSFVAPPALSAAAAAAGRVGAERITPLVRQPSFFTSQAGAQPESDASASASPSTEHRELMEKIAELKQQLINVQRASEHQLEAHRQTFESNLRYLEEKVMRRVDEAVRAEVKRTNFEELLRQSQSQGQSCPPASIACECSCATTGAAAAAAAAAGSPEKQVESERVVMFVEPVQERVNPAAAQYVPGGEEESKVSEDDEEEQEEQEEEEEEDGDDDEGDAEEASAVVATATTKEAVETTEEEEQEEEQEQEQDEEQQEVEETEEEEEEELTVSKIKLQGKWYYTDNPSGGSLFECLADDDVGEEIGTHKNGKAILH